VSTKKDDLFPKIMKFLIIWFFKLLWMFVRWLVRKIYYGYLPHKMQMAPDEDAIKAFYQKKPWYRLALESKRRYGRKCMKCFKDQEAYPGLKIVTDHIKPIRYYWHLRLDPDNVQILCDACNKAKGSVDMTDYRGYRPGKMRLPQTTPVPRRELQVVRGQRRLLIEATPHLRERGWGD
jgi:hypothetical protein